MIAKFAQFSILTCSVLSMGCIPANRVYKDGAIVSKEFSFKKPSQDKPNAQGVEHNVLLGYKTTGLLQKGDGINKDSQPPEGLITYCPSKSGTIRTLTIVGHAVVPIFLWPLLWSPVFVEVYCAPAVASTLPTSGSTSEPAQPSKDEEAARHFKEAEIQYRLLKYDEALANYQQSYVLSQQPEILFNIAQCYRQMERYEEAIATYQNFLRDQPNTPMRADVERLIEDTKALLKAQKKKK